MATRIDITMDHSRAACVYWLHTHDHTDCTKEGYIGVTFRPSRRLYEHSRGHGNLKLTRALKKYGDGVRMTVLLEGDEEYCYLIEAKLRPVPNIGWNLAEGGFRPPSPQGRSLSEEHKRKLSFSKQGRKLPPQSEETKLKRGLALRGKRRGIASRPKGWRHSQETIAKIKATKALDPLKLSEAAFKAWETKRGH